jgi:hypothetical protein
MPDDSDACDRCGRYSEDLEQTLSGETICKQCRRKKRGAARSRDADQHGLDSFGK